MPHRSRTLLVEPWLYAPLFLPLHQSPELEKNAKNDKERSASADEQEEKGIRFGSQAKLSHQAPPGDWPYFAVSYFNLVLFYCQV